MNASLGIFRRATQSLALIIHAGGSLAGGCRRRGGGAGGGGFHGPLGCPFVIAGWPGWCQGAWGRAVIRVQAAVMASAQGQVAAILSRRRGPPRVSRAAACRIL